MYVSQVRLKNIKCFEELPLELEKDGKPVRWTMIVGDNSVGKSCLLECIALGLCDEATAAALMKEIPHSLIREGTPEQDGQISASIHITFKKDIGAEVDFGIKTEIARKPPSAPARLKQTLEPKPDGFPWEDIFICGYGPQRAAEADRSYDEYDPLAAVYTLFNYESTLQNPELILRRQRSPRRKQWNKKLLSVLMLDEDSHKVELSDTGMHIIFPWGEKLPLWSLSDGYRSTTFWLLDFLSWQIFFRTTKGEKVDLRKPFTGVLLIDELEQHLHPKWQRYVVGRLRRQFPRVQFITTTHSPLVALGMSDIEDGKILALKRENERINFETIDPSELKGMRADQVLTSDVFELPTARSGDTGDKMVRLRELYLKESRDNQEEEEFARLKKKLRAEVPAAGEYDEDRKIHREIKELLNKLHADMRSRQDD